MFFEGLDTIWTEEPCSVTFSRPVSIDSSDGQRLRRDGTASVTQHPVSHRIGERVARSPRQPADAGGGAHVFCSLAEVERVIGLSLRGRKNDVRCQRAKQPPILTQPVARRDLWFQEERKEHLSSLISTNPESRHGSHGHARRSAILISEDQWGLVFHLSCHCTRAATIS